MKIKLSSDLKTITTKVLAGAQELRRIEVVIEKTKNSEPALKAELEGARKRLADAEVAVELDGATLDDKPVKAVADATNAIERATGRLAGLDSRRVECVAKLKSMEEAFDAARGSFAEATKQAIETELLRPSIVQLRAAYALATGLNEALGHQFNLEMVLDATKLPSVLDCTVDLLKFEVQQGTQYFGAHRTDPQALELTASLSDVIEAATALKKAA